LVRRGGFGNWCGYISIPKDVYERSTENQKESLEKVHGGITYQCIGNLLDFLDDEDQELLDVRQTNDNYIFGFDTLHAEDIMVDKFYPMSLQLKSGKTYKDYKFIVSETKRLVDLFLDSSLDN
jgi:hypothetical protein